MSPYLSFGQFAWMLFVAIVFSIIGIAIAARFSDGPIGPFPGGALSRGKLVAEPTDWRAAPRFDTVELQLLQPSRSRNTWIVTVDGTAYIPCALPGWAFFKSWHEQALAHPEAVVRLNRKLHPVMLVRVEDEATRADVAAAMKAKYGVEMDPADVWFFRLDHRPAQG